MHLIIRSELKDWKEIEEVILIVGKALGVYPDNLKLENIPKDVLWSSSERNKDVELISRVIHGLVQLNYLEERDGKRDYEYRLNSNFKLKWLL